MPHSALHRPKVLLVHGIDDTGRIFSRMRRYLDATGYDAICLDYTPNDGREGFDVLSRQVADKITEVVREDEDFALVGFSMGGLVVRHALQGGMTSRRPRLFVSLSSPHAGTMMAWTRWNEGGRQMRCGSPFLAQLRSGLPALEGIRLVTIRTPLDLVIIPSKSSLLADAENHSFPVLLHPLMVRDRRVLNLLGRCLCESLPVSGHFNR